VLTRTQIIDTLSIEWDKDCIVNLIDELLRLKLLIDGRYICEEVWQYAANPSYFARPISDQEAEELSEKAWLRQKSVTAQKYYPKSPFDFGGLLEGRRSTRDFSDKPVELQAIVDMLWSGYGECGNHNRTVPSAGALYPVILYLALMEHSGELSPGVYRVCLDQTQSIGFQLVSNDVARLQRAFMDPLMAEKSQGIVVIGGSLQVTAEKYANRSMLYVPLEVGHVAQNIHLAAHVHKLGTVEIGGFAEDLISIATQMPIEFVPMTTIMFGHPSNIMAKDAGLIEFTWVMPATKSYRAPFAIAQARISAELNEDWSYGRDISPNMAMIKAISEAKEWAACGCVPDNLLVAPIKDVPNVVDPRTIISFHESQYNLPDFPLVPFSNEMAYEWVEGRDVITGDSKRVFADLVYFPYFPDTPPYVFANSSGVAAHPELQTAIESSTLELIERDSFMVAYLTGLSFPSILTSSLPNYLQQRINALQQEGFVVTIKDHTLDWAPVVTVFVQNESLAFTNCASCSRFDIEAAIDHALMEVEASVLARLQNGPAPSLKPSEVYAPLHHGSLYEQKQYFRRADFMLDGDMCTLGECPREVRSWDDLINKLFKEKMHLITIPLSLSEQYGGSDDLSIVRSIIPGLIPMSFGYRSEPGGMKRLYDIAKARGKRLTYGNMRKFPHPFA
jgi:thiazole/oxazole-forming peptide maturase SagD family component